MQIKTRINFSKRMRQIMIMVLIVASLIMGGVMTTMAAPQAQTGTVTVTVTDTTGAVQPSLPVYAFSGATYTGQSATTDGLGQVSFSLALGTYNFRADLNGTQFFSGGASGIDTCDLDTCAADSVTVTTPVVVTVEDTAFVAQQGVSVYAFNGTTYANKTAVTDINGEVSLTLLPGSYNFRADFNGTQFFSGGTSGFDTCNIPDTGLDCLTDTVTVTAPTVVTVLDTNTNPIVGVPVYAFNGGTYANKTATTDINGEVSLTLLPGDYNFRADYNGTQFFSGGASGVDSCFDPCTADSVTVTIPVVVTVEDTGGAPQEGVSVYAFDGLTYSGKTGVTNAAGEVELTLLPGNYNFRADFNGTQFFSGGAAGTTTCPVPGCTADTVVVTGATVVTVSDTTGALQEGLSVYAFSGATYTGQTGVTNIDGQVSFTLTPGAYNFRADLNGTQFFSGIIAGINTCTVPGCTTDSVTVTTPVIVTVQDTDSVPQEGLPVFAYSGTTYTGKTGTTDVNGEVSFTLVPGDYNFRADSNGTQFYSGGASGIDTCNIPISGLDCTTDLVVVTLPVVVTVEDYLGYPQIGHMVYAFNGTTYTGKSGTTDANGQVSFTLVPGDYNFRADVDGSQYFSGGSSGVNTCTVPSCTTDTVIVPPTEVTFNLWATTGTLFLPDGSSVPTWGYATSATGPAELPGPMLIVSEGMTVTINLINTLGEATSMYFPGIAMLPDLVGAAANGGTASYTFVADEPGTYRYEAGLLPNAQHQVAMGMYGALIVQPHPDFASVSGMNDGIAVPSYADTIFANGPIHYWRFEEPTTASAAADQGTTGGNDGAYTGGITLNQPSAFMNLGNAALFDGLSGTFVDAGLFHPGDSVTVEAWVNLDSAANKPFHSAVARWDGSYELDVNQSTGDQANFVARNNANAFGLSASVDPLTRGDWHHLVGVFDGTTGMLTTYLDGVAGTPVALGSVLQDAGPVPDRVLIGATRDGAASGFNWTGLIDEVAIYDFVLTPAQIQAHIDTAVASFGMTLTDSTADFTGLDYLVGGTLQNITDGSSCTIAAITATTLTCEMPLSGGSDNTWAIGDLYKAGASFAYNDVTTVFDDEAVLVLSEIDPDLNNSADPAAFDMRNYKPRYWLINGQAYPNTQPIPTAAGNKVLLRYINAGSQYHTMSLMGLDQMLLAEDGNPLPYQRSVVAESIMIGQTRDMLVNVPATTPDGAKLALYDANMLLHNNNAAGFGGMMTFLATADGPAGPDVVGPTTNAVTVTPDLTDGAVDVALTATVSDVATGNANIQAAEYFIDDTNGTAVAMIATNGAFDSPVEAVEATITAATVAALSPGDHIIYVRGQDAFGNWGSFNIVTLRLELPGSGPTTRSLTLTHNPTAGDVDVLLSGTADDSATGNNIITDAEFWVGAPGADGSGTPLTVNLPAPIASIDYTIPASTFTAEGIYTLSVHSRDEFLWGPMATIDLEIDLSGPTPSNVRIAPNPNNGTLPINPSMFAARLDATLSDPISGGVQSNLYQAEFFVGTIGADGTGIRMYARDGVFDSPTEEAYMLISLININALGSGNHTIYVHGRDDSGNWGPFDSTVLVIEQGLPTVTGTAATPNPTDGATAVTLTATANSAGAAAIDLAEWFVDADPGPGNGTAMSISGTANPWSLSANIDITGWADGNYTLYTRVRDAAGNWSLTDSVILSIAPAAAYSVSVSPATGNQSGLPGATVSYVLDVTNTGNGSDTFDVVVTGNAWSTGAPTTVGPLAAGATTQMIVAVTIPAGAADGATDAATVTVTSQGDPGQSAASNLTTTATITPVDSLYFSTSGNGAVPGVPAPPPENADIYTWDGAIFTRLFDSVAAGLSGANVDALVSVSPNQFYVSFSSTNTNVPGLGNVQDEDVVYYDNGTWSVYFDGTAQGLNADGGQDIDAIDIVGGILYFSTRGSSSVPGVAGPYDDADIYSWNGASFARVWDGSVNGLQGGADIDGLEFVDATHFYLSFDSPETAVPGLGNVQDEDVIYNSTGIWSVYFDGTAQGLTAGTQDLDAIDIP